MQVAENVTRLGTGLVNWYLVTEGSHVTVVDAGLPRYRPQLEQALGSLGRRLSDVEAVILTHGHFDHTGAAEWIRTHTDAPVYVHEGDRELATTAKPAGKGERTALPYLRHPQAWRFVGHIVRAGGLKPVRIGEIRTLADGEQLDVPGRPRAIHTPGHTPGHCSFVFPDSDVLVAGDALCTLNPLTGARGPQLLPQAFTTSNREALDSLDRLEEVETGTIVFGHGNPWTQGVAAAIERARSLGPT